MRCSQGSGIFDAEPHGYRYDAYDDDAHLVPFAQILGQRRAVGLESIAKEPENRYANGVELANAFEKATESPTGKSPGKKPLR